MTLKPFPSSSDLPFGASELRDSDLTSSRFSNETVDSSAVGKSYKFTLDFDSFNSQVRRKWKISTYAWLCCCRYSMLLPCCASLHFEFGTERCSITEFFNVLKFYDRFARCYNDDETFAERKVSKSTAIKETRSFLIVFHFIFISNQKI